MAETKEPCDLVIGQVAAEPALGAEVRGQPAHVGGAALRDLSPQGGAVRIGAGRVSQGQEHRREALLDGGDRVGVDGDHVPCAAGGPHARDIVAPLGGHGLLRSRDRGFDELTEQCGFATHRGVHGVEGHPGPLRDLGDSGCGVAVVDEQLPGGGEHGVPGGGSLLEPAG